MNDFLDDVVTLDNFKIDNDYILDTEKNVNYNNVISSYYKTLFNKYNVLNSSLIAKSKLYEIEKCNKFWLVNLYMKNHIVDYLGTYTCKDKFCNNCKKLRQAVRLSRYTDLLSSYNDNLYHCVFTIPNVSSHAGGSLSGGQYFPLSPPSPSLADSLDIMSKAFSKLMRIFRNNYRCFLDLSCYELIGAIRSLEVTFVKDSYHPHYHCFMAFKNLDLVKKYTNVYSFSNRSREVRLFSSFEILLQKLWYMLINDIPITRDNYNSIDVGYSVIVDKAKEEDFIEVFKYITKATDEKGRVMSYDNFETLYWSLYRIKQIQGYGVFYNIKDEEITDDEVDSVYKSIELFLQTEEPGYLVHVRPSDLLNIKGYDVISRKKIFTYLKENKEKKNKL